MKTGFMPEGGLWIIKSINFVITICYNYDMDSQEIKTVITEYFSQQTDIDTVILFGSFAKDTYSVERHSCRAVSKAMMEEAKRRKGRNSGGCNNGKKYR